MRAGKTHYTLGRPPVTGVGLAVSAHNLNKALSGPAKAVVFDDAGIDNIAKLLSGMAETEFAQDQLNSLLSDKREPEDWRVGEAIAEDYLTECKGCQFPWPDSRDERKRGSSLPGADLVGFQSDGEVNRFAFGEVKTSAEKAYPPGAAYGRHGLKQQMEDLRDRIEVRNDLVKYLAHRAAKSSWEGRFRSAAGTYLRNSCDVRIYGILIRDVIPHENDLRARVNNLERDCPASMGIELVALYLPPDSISTLGAQVIALSSDEVT